MYSQKICIEILYLSFFDRLTMDTIFNCAFGIDIDPQKDPNNIFMTEGLRYFKQVEPHRFHVMIRRIFKKLNLRKLFHHYNHTFYILSLISRVQTFGNLDTYFNLIYNWTFKSKMENSAC